MYNLDLFRRSLVKTESYIRNHGMEVDEGRIPKCDQMKRAIEIMDHIRHDSYIEEAEKKIGELFDVEMVFTPEESGYSYSPGGTKEANEHNHKVYVLSEEIEEKEWDELIEILRDMRRWWD
jgi:hypothetical protein